MPSTPRGVLSINKHNRRGLSCPQKGKGNMKFKFERRTFDIKNIEKISPVAICANMITNLPCVKAEFIDQPMSEEARSMVFSLDKRETGKQIGKALYVSAHDNYIGAVSLNAYSISYDMGKTPVEMLKEGYTYKDILRIAKRYDKLNYNYWLSQVCVDLAKNMGDAHGAGKISPITHMSDIIKHSGEKDFAVIGEDGKVIQHYREDWRLSQYYHGKKVDRSTSRCADEISRKMLLSEFNEYIWLKPVSADGQGVTNYILSEKAMAEVEDFGKFDRNVFRFPTKVDFPRIPLINFEQWNADEKMISMKFKDDLSKWDLLDVAVKLFQKSTKEREVAFWETIGLIQQLIESVTLDPVEPNDVAVFLSNTAVSRLPKDLNCGYRFGENGGIENPEHEVQISLKSVIDFNDSVNMFQEMWLAAKSGHENEEFENADVAMDKKIADLISAVEFRKSIKAEDPYESAIFNSEDAQISEDDIC